MKTEHAILWLVIAFGASQCATSTTLSGRASSASFRLNDLQQKAAQSEARDKVLLTEMQKRCTQ